MSRRIEVNRADAPQTMPARVFNEIREHAREAHPEECCGLVLGDRPGVFREAHRCRNELTRLHQQDPRRYPRDGRHGFHMAEVDYLRVQKDAEERSLLVTGVYHSHAEVGAYFSELDQEFALQPGFPFPDAQHVVVSVVDGLVKEAAIFFRSEAEPPFAGRLLVSEAP